MKEGSDGSVNGTKMAKTKEKAPMTPMMKQFFSFKAQCPEAVLLFRCGARHYDPFVSRWLSPDPLMEKYYGMSPYLHCAGNPVNLVDKKGEKIVFVNGLLASGSQEGGEKYWKGKHSPFVKRAMLLLSDNKTEFLNVKHKWYSSSKSRFNAGYDYAQENLNSLVSDLKEGETLKFITHSMGAAYAEGMANLLIEKGYTVEMMFHFSPFQAYKIKTVGIDNGILTIDYQTIGDPVLFLGGGGWIQGADHLIIDFPKNRIDYLHREAIDHQDTWDQLEGFIRDFLNR